MTTRANGDERGFTLIELMVVVLIIAILIAIAIPTFTGSKDKADQRAAQSRVRHAIGAGRVHLAEGKGTAGIATALAAIEPGITFVRGWTPQDDGNVYFHEDDGTIWYGSVAADGSCWYAVDHLATHKVGYAKYSADCAGVYSLDETYMWPNWSVAQENDPPQ